MRKILLMLLVLLMCVTLVHAQEYDYWVYLPVMLRQIPPTPTPTPTSTPWPTLTPWPTSTPRPTATSTPVPMPTSTPRPTSTPTPEPGGVWVLPNHSHYVDSIDYLRIVGEVQNDTSYYLRFVTVAVNVFSSSGQLVGTDYTYIRLDNLPPGQKTCFRLWLDEPVGWSYYEFEALSYWTDGDPLPNLVVFNTSGSYDPQWGDYEVLGQVRNDHGTEVRFVSPVITLYNVAGTVIDCGSTYVNSTDLSPGQTSSFSKRFYSRGYADVTSYRAQVDGWLP